MRYVRFISFLIIISLSTSIPSSAAFNPLGVGQLAAATTAGSVGWAALSSFRGSFNPVTAVAGLAIGVGVYYLSQTDTVGNAINFFMGGNNPPAPAGWTDYNTPPSSISPITTYMYAGVQYGSFPLACTANCKAFYANDHNYTYTGQIQGSECHCLASNGWVSNQLFGVTTQLSCPAGYVVSGSNCVLSESPGNIAMWPSDGISSYTRGTDGLSFLPYARDPDTTSLVPSSGSYSRTGTDTRAIASSNSLNS